MSPPLAHDELDEVLDATRSDFEALRGGRLLLTGATGFFGLWLLETFAWANRRLSLGARVEILCRNPRALDERAPHLARDPAISTHAADVRTWEGSFGETSHVIHAATAASAALNDQSPREMATTIVEGTRRVLDHAARARVERFLFCSSGAVYGKQPSDLSHVPEDFGGGPDPLSVKSAYAEAKRYAELSCAMEAARVPVVVARGFAFVGPWLPLDAHFAIGNFIRDGLQARPIRVLGDGTTVRSYLYGGDLATWMWTMLFKGVPGRAYNVGSEEALTLGEVAAAVGAHFDQPVEIMKAKDPSRPADRYVPSTERARRELGLVQRTSLATAIARTTRWHCGAST